MIEITYLGLTAEGRSTTYSTSIDLDYTKITNPEDLLTRLIQYQEMHEYEPGFTLTTIDAIKMGAKEFSMSDLNWHEQCFTHLKNNNTYDIEYVVTKGDDAVHWNKITIECFGIPTEQEQTRIISSDLKQNNPQFLNPMYEVGIVLHSINMDELVNKEN